MITKSKVEDLIRRRLIKISYTFYKSDGGEFKILPDEEYVNPDMQSSIAYKLFSENFKGDRLNLSCGSIVYSHNYSTLTGRENFNGKLNFFDLNKTNNEITIQPGETISIPTNERIALNDDNEVNKEEKIYFGAIILPRLSLADAGLFYVPSYVDPTWDGVMQATLYNVSDDPIKIKVGEHLSVCKFYQVDGIPDKFFLDNFKKLNHHYALNWKNIFEGSKEPVIPGKQTYKGKISLKQKLNRKSVKNYVINNALWIIGGSFFVSVSAIISILKMAFVDFPDTKVQLQKTQQEVAKMPLVKYFELDIIPGKYIYNETLSFLVKNKNLSKTWVNYNDNEINIEYFKFSTNIYDNKYNIIFSFKTTDTIIEPNKLKIQILLSE